MRIDYEPQTLKHEEYTEIISKHAVIDNNVFYVNYGTANEAKNRIRIASIGEFGGWNTEIDESVKSMLLKQTMEMVPDLMRILEDKGDIQWLCGLRPLTADISLIAGKVSEYENLYLNVGPGYNGWKIAMRSARVLADRVEDNVDDNYFDPKLHFVRKSVLFCKMTDLLNRICIRP